MKLGKIKETVLTVLEEDPKARDDDMYLYAEVCKKFSPLVTCSRFIHVLKKHSRYKIPSFESVGRCRRKIQAERPDLQSSEKAKKAKEEKKEEFIEFSRE